MKTLFAAMKITFVTHGNHFFQFFADYVSYENRFLHFVSAIKCSFIYFITPLPAIISKNECNKPIFLKSPRIMQGPD